MPTASMPKVTKLFRAMAATIRTKTRPLRSRPAAGAVSVASSIAGRPNQTSGQATRTMIAA